MKRIYCDKCNKLVEYEVKKISEMYHIKRKKKITIIANVAHCCECNRQLFHEILDTDNQNRAFREYNKLVPEEDRIKIDG